jgi:hypothetical protein
LYSTSSHGLRSAPGFPSGTDRFVPPTVYTVDIPEAPSPGVLRPFSVRFRAATGSDDSRRPHHTGLALPGCATPSGFRTLLTFCSARDFPALFHADDAHGLSNLQRFSPSACRSCLSAPLPLLTFSSTVGVTTIGPSPSRAPRFPRGSAHPLQARFLGRLVHAPFGPCPLRPSSSSPWRLERAFRGSSFARVSLRTR